MWNCCKLGAACCVNGGTWPVVKLANSQCMCRSPGKGPDGRILCWQEANLAHRPKARIFSGSVAPGLSAEMISIVLLSLIAFGSYKKSLGV